MNNLKEKIIFYLLIFFIFILLLLILINNNIENFSNIKVIQFNPHYQCFTNSTNCCLNKFNSWLSSKKNYDFINVCMLETDKLNLPNNMKIIKPISNCGHDTSSIIYNSSNWKPIGNLIEFCLSPKPDRICLIQKFVSKKNNKIVYIISAHFPHPYDVKLKIICDNIKTKLIENNINIILDNIIILADTNLDDSNRNNMLKYNFNNFKITDNDRTCCFQDTCWEGSSLCENQGCPCNPNPNLLKHSYDIIACNFSKIKYKSISKQYNDFINNTDIGKLAYKNTLDNYKGNTITCDTTEMHLPIEGIVTMK